MADDREYAVSVKKSYWKRARLLGSGGRITDLKVHAVRFASLERAEQVAKELMDLNDNLNARAVRIWEDTMIAATALALMLSQQPLRLADSGIYNGSQAGLVEMAPFACAPNDEAAACVADDEDGDV